MTRTWFIEDSIVLHSCQGLCRNVTLNTEDLETRFMAGLKVDAVDDTATTRGHATVLIKLVDSTYNHPPREEADRGSFIRYLIRAIPTRS